MDNRNNPGQSSQQPDQKSPPVTVRKPEENKPA
jgi:hypothetical protein